MNNYIVAFVLAELGEELTGYVGRGLLFRAALRVTVSLA